MSEENVPEVNKTPDVEETQSPLKTIVENVSALASKASDLVGDALSEVADEVKESFQETVEAVKDVLGNKDDEEDKDEVKEEEVVDLGSKSLAELSDMFDKLSQDDNRMKRYKEAEAIKSAFYKRLSKEKAEAGLPHVRM